MTSRSLFRLISTTGLSALLAITSSASAMIQPADEEATKPAPAVTVMTQGATSLEGQVPHPLKLNDLSPGSSTAVATMTLTTSPSLLTVSTPASTSQSALTVSTPASSSQSSAATSPPASSSASSPPAATSSSPSSATTPPPTSSLQSETDVEALMAQQKAAASTSSTSATSSTSTTERPLSAQLAEPMSLLNQRLSKLDQLDFKDNPLGTRIKNFIKVPVNCDAWGIRLAHLVSPQNLKVLKSSPLFGHTPLLGGTPFRDQLKDLKFDGQLFLIASGAELLFKGLDKDERHQRLKHMDRMGSKEILALLQSFEDDKNTKYWKKIGLYCQDSVLALLHTITEDKIRIIFKNFGQFFSFFTEWRYMGPNEFVGLMKELTPEILQTTLDNQAVLFQPSLGASEARSVFYQIKSFTTKEAFDAFIKQISDNEINWFRYGTTPKERHDRICREMTAAKKS